MRALRAVDARRRDLALKMGADVRREAMRIAFINRPNGDLTFSGGLSGNAAADFLLGFPSQVRATTSRSAACHAEVIRPSKRSRSLAPWAFVISEGT